MVDQEQKPEQEQGFLTHLFELRDRLLRMVLAIGIVFLVLMPFAQDLYNLLSDPLVSQLPLGQKLIATSVASPFFIPYKLALMVAFVLALPYVLYQLWGFVAPGLYQHEKKLVTPLLLSSVILFYLGMAFAYFFVLPMIFSILPGFAPSNVDVTPDISEYLDFVMMMFMAFGFGFEMPVATILIIGTGMMTREELAKSRPYVIVAAFTIGMLLTPPDVLSQIMLAVPMWILFEVGLLASGLFHKQIERARAARDKFEAAEDQASTPAKPAQSAASSSVMAASATAAASAGAAENWEDDSYLFEETDSAGTKEGDYGHLSDEELDAEMERAEAEQAALDEQGRFAAGDGDTRTDSADKDK